MKGSRYFLGNSEYLPSHYDGVIMDAIASQITSLTIVYSIVYSGADQRKHQSSASLAFARGIHRWPVNSPHKGPVTRKCFHLMTSSWIGLHQFLKKYIFSLSWYTTGDLILWLYIYLLRTRSTIHRKWIETHTKRKNNNDTDISWRRWHRL